MAPLVPNVKWAQRKDRLFLTVDLQDCKAPDVKLTTADGHGVVAFHGAGEGADPSPHDYALDLTLNGDILPDESKVATSDRSITLIIQKKEDGHWPRLLAAAGKPPPNVKVDWDKWVDSDDEEAAGGDDFDFGNMASLGGGGMGGMAGLEGLLGGAGGGGGFPGMDALGGVGGDESDEPDSDADDATAEDMASPDKAEAGPSGA